MMGELLVSFQRIFFRTVQGLYFALYKRVLPKTELRLLSIEDQRTTKIEDVVDRIRPPRIQDISEEPLPEVGPSMRDRIFVLSYDLRPVTDGQLGDKVERVQRVVRMIRDQPVRWAHYQDGIFSFGFIQSTDREAVCIIDLWRTLVATISAPWPFARGPLRSGKKNPRSRDRVNLRSGEFQPPFNPG